MLERIEDIQGIGLLYQANGKSYTCHKATLIYADNGRGKSTLARVLRSVSTGDTSLIANCKTVDGTLPPKVVLQFGSGHKVSFDNGAWSEQRPDVLVFDADFIERNVHSGGTVNTGHRKNLLEFALGESAVAARAEVEKATGESKVAADKVQSLATQLSGHHAGMTLVQFEKLQKVDDADVKLVDLQKRITAASNVASILSKAVPMAVAEPTLDIDSLFVGFAISLKDVHADAEKVVRQHVAALGNESAESWLSQGRQFDDSKTCPYCDQDTSENDLISAYQTHFNTAYSDLKAKVTANLATVTSGTASSIVENFAQAAKMAAAHATAWAEQVPTETITFDAEAASTALAKLQVLLLHLARKKLTSPAEPVGSVEEKNQATDLWKKVLVPMQAANLAIKTAAGGITAYKGELASDNIQQMQQQLQILQMTKRRYDATVVELIGQLGTARKAAKMADEAKKNARENLDALMKTTLEKYEKDINVLLQKFGASFTIRGMGANFRGAAPRSEYGLLLRGKDVSVEGGPPSFATALSESDKRTLAFAFFIASTLTDAKLATRTVVIDDPMCSLDMNRKHHTRTVLRKIHSKAGQLIVLAHDVYFIRDLRDALRKEDKAPQIAMFQLTVAAGDYTGFAPLDVDKECESAYFQHHRLLNEFAEGKGGDVRSVAKAIRPMLEGYLHRRFPGLVPKELLFGQVVVLIRDALVPSPLCHAQNLVDELNEINEYAGQFHHDTNPSADAIVVVATELKTFVERALTLVHKGVATTGAAS